MPSSSRSPKRRAAKPRAPRSISPAKWATMTAAAKAVAIAKDVLYRLSTEQIDPRMGTWVNAGDSWHTSYADLQSVLVNDGISCTACAIGAAICGVAVFEDRITLDNNADVSLYSSGIQQRLTDIFGAANLRAIEAAFETEEGGSSFGQELMAENGPLYIRAVAFGQRYTSDSRRMKAIWENVAANEGQFSP